MKVIRKAPKISYLYSLWKPLLLLLVSIVCSFTNDLCECHQSFYPYLLIQSFLFCFVGCCCCWVCLQLTVDIKAKPWHPIRTSCTRPIRLRLLLQPIHWRQRGRQWQRRPRRHLPGQAARPVAVTVVAAEKEEVAGVGAVQPHQVMAHQPGLFGAARSSPSSARWSPLTNSTEPLLFPSGFKTCSIKRSNWRSANRPRPAGRPCQTISSTVL